jgi:methyl-accepting chemotaxis protein
MNIPNTPKHKRLYLINRDFQLRYTRVAVLVGIVSTALTVFIILFPLVQFRVIRFPNFVPAPFLWAMSVAAVLNFLIVAMMGILITHRIAGPMFSLVRHIRMIQGGRLSPPLQVRENDDLKYLVRNFNELLDYLRVTITNDKAQVDAIAARLADPGGTEAARALAETLSRDLAARLPPPPGASSGVSSGAPSGVPPV